MKLTGMVLIALLAAGCSSNPVSPLNATRSEVIDDPPIGEIVTRNLGDRLVAKGIRTTGEAIIVSADTTFGKGEGEASILTCADTVYPTTAFKSAVYNAGTKDSAECYGPIRYTVTTHDGSPNLGCPGYVRTGHICQDRGGQFFLSNYKGSRLDLKQDFENLTVERMTVTDATNFVQELVYNGRSGNTIKLIYREFADNSIRPAFSQDTQYDLTASDEIGFKALRIKVIKATNTSITYVLENNF